MGSHTAINDDNLPGTDHLVDLNGAMNVAHAAGGKSDIVLVPAPSSDPDDPLNWSPRRKALATTCMSVYTLMVSVGASTIFSVLVQVSEATGLSIADLNSGTGYQYLAFGWGCLVWQPLALQYGKRPVFLFSLAASMAITIAVPHLTTYGPWLACKILQGFFGAPVESLGEISVADVYFAHERGTYMSLYGVALVGGGFLAPFLAGFINDGMGWEWVMYWSSIWLGCGFIFCFFFMEETNYDRRVMESTPSQLSTPAVHESPALESTDSEKKATVTTGSDDSSDRVATHAYTRKSYLQKLKLTDKKRPFHLPRLMVRPLLLFQFPVVVYCGFTYGSFLVWFNTLNATASVVLGSAPYNFSPAMVGVAYLAPTFGVVIASLYTGLFGDWALVKIARRNNGVKEAEHRLWLLLAAAVTLPLALILWGVGAAHQIHWFGLIVAMVLVGCSIIMGAQISLAYCIDCYKDLGADAIVTVIIIRNTMGFAYGYGVTPWIANMGYQNAFILAACVGLIQVMSFLVMIKWGKKLRQASKRKYFALSEENVALGMAH